MNRLKELDLILMMLGNRLSFIIKKEAELRKTKAESTADKLSSGRVINT